MTFESPYFQTKKAFLDFLENKYGDFKVACSFKNQAGDIIWSKHINYLQLQHYALSEKPEFLRESVGSFIEKVNHRSILAPELVLDIEEPEKITELIASLKKKQCQYAFFKAGRGFHIHIILDDFYRNDNPEFKKIVLKWLGTDQLKANNNAMIALEFEQHWKTGNLKTMLENTGSMYNEN